MPGDGYFEDLFQNRTEEQTAMWESVVLCFTRARPCGTWRDDDWGAGRICADGLDDDADEDDDSDE